MISLEETGIERFLEEQTQVQYLCMVPPPAAADAAIEELRKARMKRKESCHIIIIPKLFTTLWLRQLNKVSDCNILIPPIHNFWNEQNYEKLVIAFVFPFLPYRPWQLQGTPKMLGVGRELCKMFKEEKMDTRSVLFKFLLEYRRLPELSPDVVWKMLYYGQRTPFPHCLPTDPWYNKWKRKRDDGGEQREVKRSLERKNKRPNGFFGSKRRRSPDGTL